MLRWPFTRYQLSENNILFLVAVVLGFLVGVGVWFFRQSIEWLHELFVEQLAYEFFGRFFESMELPRELGIIPMLIIAGVIVGFIVKRFVGHEKVHGVSGIMEAVALAGGRLPYMKMPFKILASALSLGAGASVGPEDPSVQIGANLGSMVGHKLHLKEEHLTLLVAAGSASAISAAFNAPIAGVFFALEVILGEFSSRSFGVVVLAAVISSAFTQGVRGANPIFGGLHFALGNPTQLPLYALLGLLLAPIAAITIRVIYWQHDFWHERIQLSPLAKTALAGALVALVALFFPQIMGAGEHVMHEVLSGEAHFTIIFLIALAFTKLLMTAVSVAGGFVGGVFAPTLFIGIMLGSAFGHLMALFLPEYVMGVPQAYAIAGMAGMLAGVVRAPITAILLVFELTNDYLLILPMMLTSVLSVFFADRFSPAGLYHLGLMRHGIHLKPGRDVDLMQGIQVREAMHTPPPTIHYRATLEELRRELRKQHTSSLCVLDDDGLLYGIVTMTDLQRAYERAVGDPEAKLEALTVGDICTREVITIAPDEPLWAAIRRMGEHNIGRLPVVKPGTREVIGLLRRHNVMEAYNMAVMRKFHDQHVAEQIRLQALTGAEVVEAIVSDESPVAGKRLCEIKWPPEAIVASVVRKNKLIVPHGDTKLRAGDTLTIVADRHAEPALEKIFGKDAIIY